MTLVALVKMTHQASLISNSYEGSFSFMSLSCPLCIDYIASLRLVVFSVEVSIFVHLVYLRDVAHVFHGSDSNLEALIGYSRQGKLTSKQRCLSAPRCLTANFSTSGHVGFQGAELESKTLNSIYFLDD